MIKEQPDISCLVLSDGRRGIENQALGLAEALSTLTTIDMLTHHVGGDDGAESFKKLTPKLQIRLKSLPSQYGLSDDYAPDIAIGCGRQAIAPLIALKNQHGPYVFTVYIQDPRLDPALFDMVILPQHDKLRGSNVLPMIGSPNRISAAKIAGETLEFKDQITPLPQPRIAALMGGASKSHRLTKPIHDHHMRLLGEVIDQGHGLMLTSSRRSPDWARADYAKLSDRSDSIWYFDGAADEGPNPYFAFLGAAQAILVTEESTNMLTEGCATGKPVYRLPMQSKKQSSKFDRLYEQLEQRCGVALFEGELSLSEDSYAPLNETQRAAEQLWAIYNARGAVIN